jgi:NADH:ubiquinone oxidoreductase subunit E
VARLFYHLTAGKNWFYIPQNIMKQRPARRPKVGYFIMRSEEMTEEINLSLIDPVLQKYRNQDDALITMLQEIQEIYGYLPEPALSKLSAETKIPMSRIYSVATFYSQFYLKPRGRNVIRVCRGTACHVRGSGAIMKTLSQILNINEGETTDNLQFTLETVRCLGTCFLAPVIMINRSYYGKLESQKVKIILKSYDKHEKES